MILHYPEILSVPRDGSVHESRYSNDCWVVVNVGVDVAQNEAEATSPVPAPHSPPFERYGQKQLLGEYRCNNSWDFQALGILHILPC